MEAPKGFVPSKPAVNPMKGFTPADIPTDSKEFVNAAKVLEWAANDGLGDPPTIDPAVARRVANVLTTLAAAFESQRTAVEEFEKAKANGNLQPM